MRSLAFNAQGSATLKGIHLERPFLANSEGLFRELRPGVRALRTSAPILADALEIGTPTLRRSVAQRERDQWRVAINGPGGYFGWNLDALDDCLSGRFGARAPFRLVWHDSAVAREHLVAGYDQRRLRPATTMEHLLDMLAEHNVEIDLR